MSQGEGLWILPALGALLPWIGLLERLTGDPEQVREERDQILELMLVYRSRQSLSVFRRAEEIGLYGGDPETGGDRPPPLLLRYWRRLEGIRKTEEDTEDAYYAYQRNHDFFVWLIVVGTVAVVALLVNYVFFQWHALENTLAGLGSAVALLAIGNVVYLRRKRAEIYRIGDDPHNRVARAGRADEGGVGDT